MNIDDLITWAIKNNIDQRTRTLFWEMLENYKNEDPDEYSEFFGHIPIGDLYLHIHTVSLNLGNWPECNYNTVSAHMGIWYNDKQIAKYEALFTLAGEPEDDYFVIV